MEELSLEVLGDGSMEPNQDLGAAAKSKWVKVSRDKRSRFGIGPRLVFAFGDPMKFGPLPPIEYVRGEAVKESRELQRSESKRRLEVIKTSMQEALDAAIEHRASTQEHKFQ
jgi:hypothetical protein